MKELTSDDMIDFIITQSMKLGVTAYEFGKNTKITTESARNVLEKITTPRGKTLTVMYDYLESKAVGSKLNTVPDSTSETDDKFIKLLKDLIKKTTSNDITSIKEDIIEIMESIKRLNDGYLMLKNESIKNKIKAVKNKKSS